MNTDAILSAAQSAAINLIESGAFISASDTVCSIESASGRIYTGISRSDMNMPVHAEAEAVQNMLAAGETVIRGLILISTQDMMFLLPCNNCIGYILSLAPENSECMIMMPDRLININEVAMFAAPKNPTTQPVMGAGTAYHAASPQFSAGAGRHGSLTEEAIQANAANSKGVLLREKVNDLLKAASEDETEKFLESLAPKKKRFGFFKK